LSACARAWPSGLGIGGVGFPEALTACNGINASEIARFQREQARGGTALRDTAFSAME
jgi:hypothetical protein